jgi:spore cortex biosynthesis protein YabQ
MVVTGLVLGVIYDFYRVIRSFSRPGSSAGLVLDIVFWVAATPATFLLLIAGNWGQLRSYVFIGIAVGLFAYFQLVSPLVLWGLLSWARWLGRLFVGITSGVTRIFAAPAFLIRRLWPVIPRAQHPIWRVNLRPNWWLNGRRLNGRPFFRRR